MSSTSFSVGFGITTFEIHIGPLMPGSLRLKLCCLEIEDGLSLLRKDRMSLIVSSVFRSHFEDVLEKPRLCDMAVWKSRGTFGRRALALGRMLDW